jgi:hypothetical protein
MLSGDDPITGNLCQKFQYIFCPLLCFGVCESNYPVTYLIPSLANASFLFLHRLFNNISASSLITYLSVISDVIVFY